MTPIDPLFIWLSIFESKKENQYMRMDDWLSIVETSGFSFSLIAKNALQSVRNLSLISDEKDLGGTFLYALNQSKLLKWLRFKVRKSVCTVFA